jgi:hypothetical protein
MAAEEVCRGRVVHLKEKDDALPKVEIWVLVETVSWNVQELVYETIWRIEATYGGRSLEHSSEVNESFVPTVFAAAHCPGKTSHLNVRFNHLSAAGFDDGWNASLHSKV